MVSVSAFFFLIKKQPHRSCFNLFIPFIFTKIRSIFFLIEEIYPCWLSIYYTIINEICTNKPRRLRRSEAIEGKGGGTNSLCPRNENNIRTSYMLIYIWLIQILENHSFGHQDIVKTLDKTIIFVYAYLLVKICLYNTLE